MKMVASAKLHKMQKAVENMLPYEHRLHSIMADFLESGQDMNIQSPFMMEHDDVKRVAIVVFSSNQSLCGAFNANIIKAFRKTYNEYKQLGKENVLIYPVGKKIRDAAVKMGIDVKDNYTGMADKPNFTDASNLARELMTKYAKKEIDKVILIYHHFKSTSSQVLTQETYLPVAMDAKEQKEEEQNMYFNYILEPSVEELLINILPKSLRLKIYTVLLDTACSEHAARTIAMQTATDNANDLLDELTLMYNKTRQQAITSELLDIMGGAQN